MTSADGGPARPSETTMFRRTLFRVILVQVIALALLWLLQATYNV